MNTSEKIAELSRDCDEYLHELNQPLPPYNLNRLSPQVLFPFVISLTITRVSSTNIYLLIIFPSFVVFCFIL